jgi:hypothetical protein
MCDIQYRNTRTLKSYCFKIFIIVCLNVVITFYGSSQVTGHLHIPLDLNTDYVRLTDRSFFITHVLTEND